MDNHVTRRSILLGAAVAAALPATPGARAQGAAGFPNRTIRIVAPYAPGGGADIQARVLGAEMQRIFGQNVVVENRTGASGVTGSEHVARSAPDGYTLVMGSSASHSVSVVAMPGLPYDPLRDFAPVALTSVIPNILVVHNSVPARTMEELVTWLRANPGTAIATAGPTSSGRFAAEILKANLQLDVTIAPYRGAAPAIADLAAGHVKVGVMDASPIFPVLRSGAARALAVTGSRRARALPDVPTVAETVLPGYEAVAWIAMFAPAGTPPDIIATLNGALREAAQSQTVRDRFEQTGAEIAIGTPEELTAFMRADIERYTAVARSAQLRFE
jgi:tripartite-type tricarboxylate transporter receptor subunit TctC